MASSPALTGLFTHLFVHNSTVYSSLSSFFENFAYEEPTTDIKNQFFHHLGYGSSDDYWMSISPFAAFTCIQNSVLYSGSPVFWPGHMIVEFRQVMFQVKYDNFCQHSRSSGAYINYDDVTDSFGRYFS